MYSVSRFLMAGKLGLKRNSNLLMKDFLKIKMSSFGAKVKGDSDVDKSKKSVSGGGATASDSEFKREPVQQTIKVAKVIKPAEQAAVPKQEAQETQEAPQVPNTGIKVIKSIPGNRVRPYFN